MSISSKAPRELSTPRLKLALTAPELAAPLADYHLRNRDFLSQFSPLRPQSFYTEEGQRALLEREARELADDMSYRYYLFLPDDPRQIIGHVGLGQVIRGGFQSAFVSYTMDAAHLRRGYMTEALSALVEVAFHPLALHRLEANIMPRNLPSLATAARCGFHREGLSPKYLCINGVWEDHVHMVRRNLDMEAPEIISC